MFIAYRIAVVSYLQGRLPSVRHREYDLCRSYSVSATGIVFWWGAVGAKTYGYSVFSTEQCFQHRRVFQRGWGGWLGANSYVNSVF